MTCPGAETKPLVWLHHSNPAQSSPTGFGTPLAIEADPHSGDILIIEHFSGSIWRLRYPAGDETDFDNDGDFDLADYEIYGNCMSGPGVPLSPGCEEADCDQDGDVDVADFEAVSANVAASL